MEIYFEDHMEVFDHDNSEPEDAWWNEQLEDEYTYEEPETKTEQESQVFKDILETLSGTQNYGTIGDYYHQALGCYVFPSFEVYEYFIDIDAVGHEWTEASDGHYLPLLYLEAYEEYISVSEETEEEPEEVMPSENELQTLETLESVRGMLSVIKENNAAFYDEVLAYQDIMLEYQEEALVLQQETAAMTKGILYTGITQCILLGIIAGSFLSHTFFNRMRAG